MTDELARSWDEAARGYERYLVPRFAPWVATAVGALPAALPPGPILVPCCGTFPELDSLTEAHPGRELVGVDLSAGMIALARERAAGRANVRLLTGDATALAREWPGTAAAVVSVFGLQQLPDPAAAIADWSAALAPGGSLSVVYWPPRVEDLGPFALFDEVIDDALGDQNADDDDDWPAELAGAAAASGLVVDGDEKVSHVIEHDGPEEFWTALVVEGQKRRLVFPHGEDFAAAARAEFLRRAPSGPWRHRPTAGHITAHRPAT